jgi:hypothetical protein
MKNEEFNANCYANKFSWGSVSPKITKIQLEDWINELRSGTYDQSKTYLRIGNQYCCLGVLAELHNLLEKSSSPPCRDVYFIEGAESSFLIKDRDVYFIEGAESSFLIKDRDADDDTVACVLIPLSLQQKYAGMNDKDDSFDDIADELEKDFGLV